jgi:hypothetical protein
MPSLLSLGIGAACKGIGKLAGKAARAAGKVGKRLGRNMKPGFLNCKVLRAEPVNITTGEVVVEQRDFELPWPLPLIWTRRYSSQSAYEGMCGRGWETPADSRLVWELDGTVTFYDGTGTSALFPSLPDSRPVREFVDGAILARDGESLTVCLKSGLTYHFSHPAQGATTAVVDHITDRYRHSIVFLRYGQRLFEIVSDVGPRVEVHISHGRIEHLRLHHPAEPHSRTLVRYEYDAAGDLCAVYDQLDAPYRFQYQNHCLIRHTDRNDLSFYYEYDQCTPEGRAIRSWGDGGLYSYSFVYDSVGREVQITDSL